MPTCANCDTEITASGHDHHGDQHPSKACWREIARNRPARHGNDPKATCTCVDHPEDAYYDNRCPKHGWRKTDYAPGTWFTVPTHEGVAIANQMRHIGVANFGAGPEEAMANAKLMAAAPKLLAALKELSQVAVCDEDGDEFDRSEFNLAMTLATEAIAAVEGK
ncbi:MAG TPA: hypothetical protein VD994_12780 [Prosthecobacter sp.]|nr:hypothetical protein [Prosthecobacter sp.]